MTTQRWDAIVVGGGHNGLVAAAYLGRAGLRTLLLEQRETVGGAVGTSEIAPSAWVPTLAHTVGRLTPSVARELELSKHGLRLVQPAAVATSPGADAPCRTRWRITAPRAWRAEEDDVLLRGHEVELPEVGDDVAAHRALVLEVELLEALARGEAGRADAGLTTMPGPGAG